MPKCSKAIDLWVSGMSGLYPEYGIKMMEIKDAEINAPPGLHLINNAEINAHRS